MGGGIKEGGLGTQRGDELRFPILRDYFECASTAFIMTRFRFAFVSGRARAVLATSGRVDEGSYLPPPPTDPDVRN